MTLEQYNQILHSINKQIEELQKSREALIDQNYKHIDKQIKKRQSDDRRWFINNFDIFWTNLNLFKKDSPNADIVIDFFPLYTNRAKYIHHISISDLIALWDLGYKYQGYPIVEYTNHRFEHSLTYIKDNKIVNITSFADKDLGFSPILNGILDYLSTHKKITNSFEEYKTLKEMKEILAN